MEITRKRRAIIKKALLCYTSHILDNKYKNHSTKEEAITEMNEDFDIVNDIKLLEKQEQSELE